MSSTTQPTNQEVVFETDDIIVSKTDLKGRITYANRTFCTIAGYSARGAWTAAQQVLKIAEQLVVQEHVLQELRVGMNDFLSESRRLDDRHHDILSFVT